MIIWQQNYLGFIREDMTLDVTIQQNLFNRFDYFYALLNESLL